MPNLHQVSSSYSPDWPALVLERTKKSAGVSFRRNCFSNFSRRSKIRYGDSPNNDLEQSAQALAIQAGVACLKRTLGSL
jgi:hypothetical protein